MEKGNLVQRVEDLALGIIISINGLEAEVLFGDGLREIVNADGLTVIPFKPRAVIPANFIEMVDAFVTLRGFE